MKKMLVLGIGSRIMMDDAIGIYLAEDLKQHIINPCIEFVIGETDIDYCISQILKYKHIIVIDAYLSGKSPGEITEVKLSDLKKERSSNYSLHGMHFLDILQGLNPEVEGILIGIEPCEINFGFSLSDVLEKCYSNVFKSVYSHIIKYIEICGGMKYA